MRVSSTQQGAAVLEREHPVCAAQAGAEGQQCQGNVTVPQLLCRQARQYGERPWLQAPGGQLSFGEAPAFAARWAALLAHQGVARGDRVVLMMGNRMEFLGAVLGCAWLGAVAVPVNTASRGMQLQHILSNSAARLALADAAACGVLSAVQDTPLACILLVGGGLDADAPAQVQPLPDLPQAGLEAADLQAGDTLAILYTSGTSGLSKGVCCPHAQFYWWGVLTARNLEIGTEDVLYTCLPLFHTNALNACFQALVTGAAIVCDERFSVSRYFERLCATGATVTYLLGAMVPMLLSREVTADERGHRARIALAPGVPARFHQVFQARTGIALLEGYGSTETNFAIGGTLAQQRADSMGRVMPEFEACVADDNDQPLPDGEPGELLLRPRLPFLVATGYFGMPDKTVEAWRNLWFHTGDRVVRDADGHFRFLDRMKDAIRRRGENISSFEVEQVLQAHPAVEAAAVYAVRSELAEDEVMAALVFKPGQQASPEALLDHCQPRMPYFSVPRYLRIMTALPRTENGKIRKFGLRDEGVTADTWDRESVGYQVLR
ncbi:ATP-dependent acyl-CoA ligase [Kerstersia gyiorum]|uniref:ATP-dependent acyl-CoA ligase n=1 Tax=Kerstersia gyiorum TaxID=206506 RepID=UPI00214FAB28|nr:ATP-dependent acyl-CoA ligase [Kerstersia gyiorum]MCR4160613.1 ATP-dependent acyl-CoA ligase [Kerstersia gyiorum]